MLSLGTKVRIVVPYGPNQGQEEYRGEIVGKLGGGIDGDCYDIIDTTTNELHEFVSAIWVKEI